jgi:hypothetical protein
MPSGASSASNCFNPVYNNLGQHGAYLSGTPQNEIFSSHTANNTSAYYSSNNSSSTAGSANQSFEGTGNPYNFGYMPTYPGYSNFIANQYRSGNGCYTTDQQNYPGYDANSICSGNAINNPVAGNSNTNMWWQKFQGSQSGELSGAAIQSQQFGLNSLKANANNTAKSLLSVSQSHSNIIQGNNKKFDINYRNKKYRSNRKKLLNFMSVI